MSKIEKKEIRPEKLPPKSNFINWYNSVLELAEIADRKYPVKGTFVWLPYGLKIMKNLKEIWDKIFQANGIEEVYFPLFVPMEFIKKNKEWFEGFKENLYLALPFSSKEEEKIALRPTGEPAMYPIFKIWIKNGKLPIRIYQTVSSFRYEGKTTHTMIRDREITFWYEIHTAHKTKKEAEEEFKKHVKFNEYIWNKVLCIPPIKVDKPKYEIFPGAISAIEFYTILPNGRLLENGSANNLGQAYAKKFDLYYIENKKRKYCWQICTGNGARYLVATFSLHGDERGLVLPPKIAPIQIIIIPIFEKGLKEKVLKEAKKLEKFLKGKVRVKADLRESVTPGEKFYIWDIKGVPLRIEIGKEEISKGYYTIFRRDTKERYKVKKDKLIEFLNSNLNKNIPKNLFNKIREFYNKTIKYFSNIDNALKWIENGKVAKINWCGEKKCYEDIVSLQEGIEPIGTLLEERKNGKCICGKKTNKLTLVGKVY